MQVDGLVNTCNKELNLSNGAVSKSILAAAGNEIQAEVKRNAPPSFTYGDVVETKGYKLKAHFVYHGACRGWDNNAGHCEQTMRQLIQNVLTQASAKKLKSLAMPAIGTGNLRIPHSFVASVMYDEIMKFSQKHINTTLCDIRIVVYGQDRPTITAFEDKIRDLEKGAAPFIGINNATSGSAPQSAGSDASISSTVADKISFDSRTKTLTVGPLKMNIVEGDITQDDADAIINSTNEKLDLSGAVAKAILNKGGDALKNEIKKARIGTNRLCVTSAGNLPAKNIVHLVAAHNYSNWKLVIMNCLVEAETRKWKRITLPALGTGNISQPVDSAVSVIVDTIVEFASRTPAPSSLQQVTVCIYQHQMVQQFTDALSRKLAGGFFKSAAKGLLRWASNIFSGSGNSSSSSTSLQVPLSASSSKPPSPKNRIGGSAGNHLSRIVVHIYALSQKAINDAVNAIENAIRDSIEDYIIEDQEIIKKLTDDQVRRIVSLSGELEVRITVERHQRINRIRIQGPKTNVTRTVERIHCIFQENFKQELQAVVGKMAQWEYVDNDRFEPYPDEINTIIENAFSDKKQSAEWEESDDVKFRIDFSKMEEETIGSKKSSTNKSATNYKK
jgi:poly [ADP-ribose] polymerase 10/14/15